MWHIAHGGVTTYLTVGYALRPPFSLYAIRSTWLTHELNSTVTPTIVGISVRGPDRQSQASEAGTICDLQSFEQKVAALEREPTDSMNCFCFAQPAVVSDDASESFSKVCYFDALLRAHGGCVGLATRRRDGIWIWCLGMCLQGGCDVSNNPRRLFIPRGSPQNLTYIHTSLCNGPIGSSCLAPAPRHASAACILWIRTSSR